MRYILFICVVGILSCQNINNEKSSSTPIDPCESLTKLSGKYKHDFNQGIVTWNGELSGTIEFAGADYNDMVCTYSITDCPNGSISMTCDGSEFNTQIIVQSPDTILLNSNRYVKL